MFDKGKTSTSSSSQGTSQQKSTFGSGTSLFGKKTPGFGGIKTTQELSGFEESTKLEDLEDDARNIFIDTFDKLNANGQTGKSSEGADSYGKRIIDMYDNSNHAVQESLVVLASEVDYGLSALEGARADLDTYHSFIANSYNSPYMETVIDDLEKRKVNLSDAISDYENKLQEGKEIETPDLLVQVLQEQNEAIVRCSARVSEIQRMTDELKEKKKINKDADDSKKTILSTVQTSFENFIDERRRNLEKRDTTTDFKDHYDKEKQAAAAAKTKKFGGFGGNSKFGGLGGNSKFGGLGGTKTSTN